MIVRRAFEALLARRALAAVALLALTALLGRAALGVRTDLSVEYMFPVRDATRATYDRFKEAFPYEDARALVIVEAPDLFTAAGLARARALEEALSALPGVVEVRGLLGAKDVVGEAGPDGDEIRLAPLFPDPAAPPEDLAARERTARTDPLFAWALAHPTRPAATIGVRLALDVARADRGRRTFYEAAAALVERERPRWERIALTGIPAIRGQYVALVNRDNLRIFPVAFAAIVVLLALAFRSVPVVLAAVATIVVAIIWTAGVMAALGIPWAILTILTPVIVMIISISDTVHIVADYRARAAAGASRERALVAAMEEAAIPCLLTEVTIACGFLSMALVNIVGIVQFGVVTAAGMLLAWAANVTVLPLLLFCGSPPRPLAGGRAPAFITWIERQVTGRPRAVAGCAAALLLACAAAATRIGAEHSVFEDLRPESAFYRDLRYAEAIRGGVVPVAVFLEPEPESEAARSPAPALEPAALGFIDRAEARLESYGCVKAAGSVASYLRKGHRIFTGEPGLPATRAAAAQELLFLDDGKTLRDLISPDHRAAAAIALVPDLKSGEIRVLLDDLRAWVAREVPAGYRAEVTGVLAISSRVSEILVEGLLRSFGGAVLASLAVFAFVLRSARLALIGLLPNLAPIVLTLGFMALLGIDLKPSTVLIFSMILVIADDDTIQYLARFRGRFATALAAGAADPWREAALGLLRDLGRPMLITSSAIAAGFFLLRLSAFLGPANLGTITALALFSAVFADLFLLPVIIMKWRPNLGPPSAGGAADQASGMPAAASRV